MTRRRDELDERDVIVPGVLIDERDVIATREHRVASHLGIDLAAYDQQIRRYIPGYDEMLDETLAILEASLPPGGENAVVIDLGTGTGVLACAILDRLPAARVVLVDIDPAMLQIAASRVAHHASRVELRRARFDEALEPCDAVVASLALHHVSELADKRALYQTIYQALRPGGLFLVADVTVHESGREHSHAYRVWRQGIAAAGIPDQEAKGLFAKWAGEDRYLPLTVELANLASAGFLHPECFWRRGPMTVFGGFAS